MKLTHLEEGLQLVGTKPTLTNPPQRRSHHQQQQGHFISQYCSRGGVVAHWRCQFEDWCQCDCHTNNSWSMA